MKTTRSFFFGLSALILFAACKDNENKPGAGLVVEAGAPVAADDAAAAPVADPMQCPGCQLAPTPAWTFEGIFRDPECTDPLAQLTAPACSQIPALGPTSVTYVDDIGGRKANETANVAVVEQVPGGGQRYRKVGTKCVRANEGAVDITPAACQGQRVCRDANGALACTGCRTFANGCPDFEETRLYATINDPSIKKVGGGTVDKLASLRACCAAIAAEARRQGNAPELLGAAAQCQALVAAAGPSGNAPEFAAIRGMLAGRSIPGCAGL
ncbi:MAG: hypothetical protein KF819_17795 [Labilithrix sp.]|nr:hypothetical protein [Labilithrix sp.]